MTSLDRAFLRAFYKVDGPHAADGAPHLLAKPAVVARAEAARAPLVGQSVTVGPATAQETAYGGFPISVIGDGLTSYNWLGRAGDPAIGEFSPESASQAHVASQQAQGATAQPAAAPELAQAASLLDRSACWTGPSKLDLSHQAQPASAARIRAVFEVPEIEWPQLCEMLLREAAPSFEAAADALLADARLGHKLRLVTSRSRGVGRTTLALCLAAVLTRRGRQVCLVDADFERPELARRLKLLPHVGWEHVLCGEAPLEEALIEAVNNHLVLLPLKDEAAAPAAGHPRVAETFDALREQFDLVLVDAGPADETGKPAAGLLAACRTCDAALVVRDARADRPTALEPVCFALERAGVSRWDIVENFAAR